MKNNLTEIVFILDESGSMESLTSDTIGGFNSVLSKQKKEDGEAYVTTYFFNNTSRMIHDRVAIEKVNELTEEEYCPGGCTALIDAIGGAVEHISAIHKYARPDDVPGNTIFVIMTDGFENASCKYTDKEVKEAIGEKKKMGWQFIFLGANIDAVKTASHFGIDKDCAVDYIPDAQGTDVSYCCMSEAISSTRKHGRAGKKWRAACEADFNTRK